jgi:6-phosphogluconolactonase
LPDDVAWTAINPTDRFLYIGSVYTPEISGFIVNADGSPFATGSVPVGLAVDSTGNFLYVTNVGAKTISAYNIHSDGALVPVPGSPFQTGLNPESVLITP